MSRKIKSPKSNDKRSGLNKNIFWILLAVYTVLSLLLFDPKLFTGGDNAVYINLAQSLVQGKGYKNLNLPGEPGHTQYPPGFPALLGLVMLIFGESVLAMKFFILACGLAAFYLFYLICLRIFKERYYLAAAAYILVPVFIIYNHWILSEIPFLLCNLAALYLFMRAEDGKKGFYYPAFACAYFAFFIRTTGIALIGAVFLTLLVRKRYKELGIFLGGFVILFIAWQVRNSHYPQTGGYLDQFLAKYYYKPELGRIGIVDFLVRIVNNFVFYFFTVIPQSLFAAVTGRVLLIALGVLSLALLVAGFIVRRRTWSIIEFFLLFGLAVLLVWPEVWSSDRFLLPILPVLVIYILLGLTSLRSRLAYALPAVAAFFILANLWAMLAMAQTAVADNLKYLRGDRYAGYSTDWRRYFEAIAWIKKNVPGDQVIMARKPEFVYLLSHHKSFIFPFTNDREEMVKSIKTVDYIILDNFAWTGTSRRYLVPVLQEKPELYDIVYQTPPPEFYVLKVKK